MRISPLLSLLLLLAHNFMPAQEPSLFCCAFSLARSPSSSSLQIKTISQMALIASDV
jgi:hypothetical protein